MQVTSPFPAGARRGPAAAPFLWFPHAFDLPSDRVLLVKRTAADLRGASFLDDRSLPPETERKIVSWSEVAEAIAPNDRRDAQYIFHIGHVGSTLVSRLLGEIGTVLALREPMILRTFHEAVSLVGRPEGPWPPEWLPERFDTLAGLLSRTFDPGQRALVKATSFTSDLAGRLVRPGSRALLMYATPENFVASLLAGEGARADLHQLAGRRLARLAEALGEAPWTLWTMSEGEKAAMSWLCEMLALMRAARDIGEGDVAWLDFDLFLEDAAARLGDLAAFFGHPVAADEAVRIGRGPLMGRYSKGPEHAYSPQLRRDVLASSAAGNRPELKAAAAWLADAARRFPQAADCLNLLDR